MSIKLASIPNKEDGSYDIEEIIAKSVHRNAIIHINVTADAAQILLADFQADEDYEGDAEDNQTIEVWGTHHLGGTGVGFLVRLQIIEG
jgi:hypothetical protein